MRNLFGAAAVILAALSAPIALTLTGTPALAQPGSDVTGWNVEVVQTAGGSFRKQPGGDWVELDASGRTAFNFQETGRDDWSVYLNDTSRDVQLQLDLHRRKVTYGTNGGAKSDLYDILNVRSAAAKPAPQSVITKPAPQSGVNGRSVETVKTANGSFNKRPDGSWVEQGAWQSGRWVVEGDKYVWIDGSFSTVATFEETGRDEWSVYLHDASRDVQLQLDLHRRKVTYGTNGGAKSDLYDIIEVSGAIRPTQQPKANPPAQRPQNTSYPAPNQRIPVPTPTQRAPNNPYPPQNTSQSGARTRNVNASPIWDQRDAELKCPVAAHAVNGRWTGGWRTTVTGKMSVCEIAN